MASVAWVGNGQNIAQVTTLVVNAVAVGGTLSATINGKSITYTCVTGDTTATAATNWQALLTASDVPPEFGEIDWTVSGSTITATAGTPGTPYTLTKSQSGGATCTLTTTVANSSQSDLTNAANWNRLGIPALPTTGDDVIIANTAVPILWNLDGLSGVLLNSWTRYQSFTGTIGLPENNPLGYVEYRPTYLELGSNVNPALDGFALTLGPGEGSGPTRERYDMQSYRTNFVAIAAGAPEDAYSIRFLGSHGENNLKITNVSVGVAMLPTETFPTGATIGTATVDGGGTLDCGTGCTFSGTGGGGSITITGGTSTLFCVPNIVARNNATVTLSAPDGTYSTITAVNGVQMTITCAMTITSLTLQKSSNLDASQNLGDVTITSSTMDGDTCQILDPNNTITFTNATTVAGQVSSGPITFTGSRTLKLT